MELTATNVKTVFLDCLPKHATEKDLDNPKYTLVRGITGSCLIVKEKIEEHKQDIADFLNQLDPTFREDTGGGWSFIKLPFRKDGYHWGEHLNCEQLCVLAVAAKLAVMTPPEMNKVLPGSVPYIITFPKEETLESFNSD